MPNPTDVPALALRDRIAAALYERERPPSAPAWSDAYAMDREVFEAMADAVLAVLPPPADRAAVLLEAADALAALGPTSAPLVGYHARGEDIGLLRRMAAEEPQR